MKRMIFCFALAAGCSGTKTYDVATLSAQQPSLKGKRVRVKAIAWAMTDSKLFLDDKPNPHPKQLYGERAHAFLADGQAEPPEGKENFEINYECTVGGTVQGAFAQVVELEDCKS